MVDVYTRLGPCWQGSAQQLKFNYSILRSKLLLMLLFCRFMGPSVVRDETFSHPSIDQKPVGFWWFAACCRTIVASTCLLLKRKCAEQKMYQHVTPYTFSVKDAALR
ncbi:hypothetical protein VMCG_01253 [Cytospora schulzeri]|uniref:Uncharacterized protein n=1 Tax=Cytospora schulzeri TaxID=448051 RepID=A0A423X5Z7_9PEZI|nr:hypothetical protein VMCG_01253 [Valsa malicola]